jgi:5-methylcytosine-specific restriction endonuclease McrA
MARKNKKAALKIATCKCGTEVMWRTRPRLRCDACRSVAILEDKARYRSANRADIRAKSLRYARTNAETMNAKRRAWRRANPEKNKEQKDDWRHRNPLKASLQVTRHNARKMQAEGTFTDMDFVYIIENQDRKCFYCSTDISLKPTVDHYIPLSRGGSNWSVNIVAACKPCNSGKCDRMPYDFQPALCDRF